MIDTVNTDSIDVHEAEVVALEGLIARARLRQAELLLQLDAAQVASMDGCRSMLDWTVSRLDVTHATARKLLRAAKGVGEGAAIDRDGCSFDRLVETLRLADAGASPSVLASSRGWHLAGVRRVTARHRRLRKVDEEQAYRERYLATQGSLDGSEGRFWGQVPGFEFRLFEKAVDQRADLFRDLPGPVSPGSARRADALVSIAQDSLDGVAADRAESRSSDPVVTVFVDGNLAADTGGEAGAEIEFGPKVGPATLERILCAGAVKLVGMAEGEPVTTTRASRAIPPAVRHAVLWRDGGCTIDGCRSRYRLQPHHVRPWSAGGSHGPENLTTLCWYHHHVVIHGEGGRLDPASPPGKRRFLRFARAGPP
jgi:hypothetical protein